jgi:hypothetical protein
MMHVENRLALEAWAEFLFWVFVIVGAFAGWVWIFS